MQNQQKVTLLANKDYMIRCMNLDENLFRHLKTRGLLDEQQQQHIQNLGTAADQVQALLDAIVQNPDHDTFDRFCSSVYAAGQLHVVLVLNDPDAARSSQYGANGYIPPVNIDNNVFDDYPEELRSCEFFDISILHKEDDYDAAMELKNDLIEKIILEHGQSPKIVVQNDPDHLVHIRSMIQYAEQSIKRASFVFVFVPKTDPWSEILGEEFLMTVMTGEKKKWCKIKVFREAREVCEKNVQFGYKADFGLDITRRDKYFYERVRKLLNVRCHDRLEREREVVQKRRMWSQSQQRTSHRYSEDQRDTSTREASFRFTESGERPLYEENARSRSETPEANNETYEGSSRDSTNGAGNRDSTERRQRNPGLHLEMNAYTQRTFSDQPTPLGEENTSLPAQTPGNIEILRPFLDTYRGSEPDENAAMTENIVTDGGTVDNTEVDSQEDVPSSVTIPTASPPIAIVRPSPVGRSPSPTGAVRFPADTSVEEQHPQGSQFLPSQASAPTFQNTGASNRPHVPNTPEPLSLDLRSMPPDGGDREVDLPTEQQNTAATMPPIFCHSDVEGHPSLFLASFGGSVNALSSHTVGTMRIVLSRTPPLRQDSKVDSVRPDDNDEVD